MTAIDVTAQPSLPSRYRVEPGSCDIPIGVLPKTCTSTPEKPEIIASNVIEKVNSSIAKKDAAALASLFIDNSYWRDHLCLTWEFRTLKGAEALSKFVVGSTSVIKLELDNSSPFTAPHNGPIDAFGEVHGIEFFVKVSTSFGNGRGIVRLAQEGEEWKIFTVFTTLNEITSHEELVNGHRPVGVQHGAHQGRTNWQDRRTASENYEEKDPAVLIVGMYSATLTTTRCLGKLS
jgi:hypothetical protein